MIFFGNYIFFQPKIKNVLYIVILNIIREIDKKSEMECNREILFNNNVRLIDMDNPSKNDLDSNLSMMKHEIDALQIAVLKKKEPWYVYVSVIISVFALISSIAATYISFRGTEVAEYLGLRSELTTLLAELNAISKENLDLQEKYKSSPNQAASASVYLNQKNAIIALRASEIALKIPTKVSSSEFIQIALAQQASGDTSTSILLFERAIEASNSNQYKIIALQQYANSLYLAGDFKKGRSNYEQAVRLIDESAKMSKYEKSKRKINLYFSWVFSEINVGNKDSAMENLVQAKNLIKGIANESEAQMYLKQIMDTESFLSLR